MKFNYKKLTKGLDRPIIRIELKNPRSQQQISFLALVDSGADICLMPGAAPTISTTSILVSAATLPQRPSAS